MLGFEKMTYNNFLQFCQTLSKQSIAQLVCIGLGLIILWQLYLASSLWRTVHNQITPQDNGVSVPVSIKHPMHKSLKQPFFGFFVPKSIDDAGVQVSLLNIKVVGVLFAMLETDSEVILKIDEGKEQTFRVGDVIPGQAVIKRITPQGVLVERKGQLERLILPKNELIFEPQAKPLLGQ